MTREQASVLDTLRREHHTEEEVRELRKVLEEIERVDNARAQT